MEDTMDALTRCSMIFCCRGTFRFTCPFDSEISKSSMAGISSQDSLRKKQKKKHQTTIRCIGVVCLVPIRFSFTKKSGLFWFTNKHRSNKQHSHTIRSLPMSALVQTWTAGETDGFCWVPNLLAEILFSIFMLKKKHVKFHRKK